MSVSLITLMALTYPENVHFLKPQDVFRDELYCYAVKDGDPLYFEGYHPFVLGASKLVEIIKQIELEYYFFSMGRDQLLFSVV